MNKVNRNSRNRLVAAIGILAFAVCALATNAQAAEASTSNKELTEIRITVTHFPTLLYAVPYIVAMEKGFFADEGIRITEIAGSEGGGTTVRNVVTGGLPFGEVATPAAVQAYIAGFPLVAVGGGVQSVAELNWVTTPDSPVNTIEDVVGKVVAYTSPGSVTQGTLALSLHDAGVDPSRVNMRALGGIGEGLTALQGGAVAAAANLAPVFFLSPENKYKVVWWANEYISEFQQTVIITGAEMASNNPDLVRGFLRARARGVQWIHEHPEKAARMWAEKADFAPDAAIKSVNTVLKDDYWGIGLSRGGLAAVGVEMHAIDLVADGDAIDWDGFMNQEFLPQDVERIDPTMIRGQ